MTILTVRHLTSYRYRRPVTFGEHRLMFRPRDSHDLRLVDTALAISPRAQVRWLHDVFSNSIAIASFEEPAEELRFESRIVIDHFGLEDPDFGIEPYAQTYPFSYSSDEIPDLGRTVERHYPDPDRAVDAWAKAFVQEADGIGPVGTFDLLLRMNAAIHERFDYRRRYGLGTQTPIETLEHGGGSCRDYALFMMEAARALGFAARFVSGYLYDPALDQAGAASRIQGAGDTHAWVQVYLPGAGWVEFDPTNGKAGGANLIRVAVARDPSQAMPLQGTYYGGPDDYLEMTVEVEVRRGPPGDPVPGQLALSLLEAG
ncbi:Transglutaminase-like enzyme, putative cysteine protease [Tistlia consotensis]|uniref:Transglutaminase-like enzyme, putative cysteine protease n=1 Tax=Tistlia consotensis USBA 355 TaxID=560819 RepID=A0A1Y6BJX2_9PROT|nr:transglutaminase family protein [Tistlia consotensis]SMF11670.1 Transglutaminase-like enzyme, putative cysteine protease [Tistlia consotensis USBA 355]SNR51732.1 Transglutaminase-like enzyme, putative cysteine protease [Tistlia consotensis]